MAAIGFTSNYAHIKAGGITSWKVKLNGDASEYSLGSIEEGKLDAELVTEDDSNLRNLDVSLKLSASGKCVNTDTTDMIKILDSMASDKCTHILSASNGQTFYGDWGTTIKLVSDADADKNMYMEIGTDIYMAPSAWSTVIGGGYSPGTPNVLDKLYPLNSLPATRKTAGFAKVEAKATSGDTYEDMGAVKNGKMTAELMTEMDGVKASRSLNAWLFTISFDQMQTSSEYALLPSVLDGYFKITFISGLVLTIGNNVGLSWKPSVPTTIKNAQLIHWELKGAVQSSAWDALWT